MRSFEERKAEIFRRSENRIKEHRRHRNRVLSLCIPLCLAVACSAAILPGMLSRGMNKSCGEAAPEHSEGMTMHSVQVEMISEKGDQHYHGLQNYLFAEDADKVVQFYDSVEDALEAERGKEENKESSQLDITDKEYSVSGTGNSLPAYKITFTTASGEKVVYTLEGYVLTKEQSDERVVLTDDQRKQFLDSLLLLTTSKGETQ